MKQKGHGSARSVLAPATLAECHRRGAAAGGGGAAPAAPDDSSDRRSTRAVALERGPDLSPGGSIAVIAARPRSVLPALRAGASRGVAALDIKKLGRMVKIGHRITGDPRDRVEGAGWEYVHVAIDDHSRAGACHARRRPPSRPRRRRLPRAIHRESPFRCPARHRAPSRSRERRNCSSKRAPGRCWTHHVRGERDQRSKADTYSHAALGRWRRSGRAKSCCQRLEGIGVAASEARDRAC